MAFSAASSKSKSAGRQAFRKYIIICSLPSSAFCLTTLYDLHHQHRGFFFSCLPLYYMPLRSLWLLGEEEF
ncbi:hypothetical protein B0T14DRAFT_16453 [Immersiella caudata]|uniref:Uncharacterized protein n=1 Tax=Immersiella caudata TaxID=314043 RepID=A0AA39XDH3_9PEZI|nr:hypothetical protein B0T14DRAFT_16453 [Immersiella caudata]